MSQVPSWNFPQPGSALLLPSSSLTVLLRGVVVTGRDVVESIEGRSNLHTESMTMAYRFILSILLALTATHSFAADRVYTLQDAYEAALGTSEIVKIAEEGVVQAESIVDQAWTYVYPRLTGEAGYTRYNEILPPSGGFVFQPLDDFRAGLILTQPLYTGGRTFAALRSAKKLRAVSRGELKATKQDTLLNVAEAYYGVLRAQ
ncbi:MAG TPA: hypothetical protein DCO77_03995, partial [Nitrospiraceae bacterium]|nr:hypothetical protein [Nitrospiraceae bacterium]